ncbi:hypothetical protein D0B54_06355 [Solimonas sp. K1W22B-7]|uniref:hypothetical protein n=1 Tax=Solimonas sp. K1W22B-7 TaxID=2303331 RepID=UPI000E331A98|nr:hypothetical protein [Solimonas sp. K1W22B-7]AXQ28327.1 hypothetical protein D0B54_06355 [Solimonas sp. K1W22B-7]
MSVFLVDRLIARPGRARELLRAYRERYVPGAQARGLRLERTLLSPPLWLEEQSNTLEFVWAMDGAAGFWAMTLQARPDPAMQGWWREAQELIESRERYLCAAVEELPSC